jgi:hypothetical protein
MREIEGFAYEEIADILQINLGTVKSRLMRGRAALRSVLAPAIGSSSSAQASVVAPAPVHDLPRVSHHLPPAERAAFHCDADRLRTQASSLPDSTLDSGLEVSQ